MFCAPLGVSLTDVTIIAPAIILSYVPRRVRICPRPNNLHLLGHFHKIMEDWDFGYRYMGRGTVRHSLPAA